MCKDLRLRLRTIASAVKHIERYAEEEPRLFKKRIMERIQSLNADVAASPERIAEEVAYFADRCDITEEIVRLRSHLDMTTSCLTKKGEVGRRLDFIAQEMNREVNTIGSKSQNAQISQQVITVKLEIDKLREQIQNIE